MVESVPYRTVGRLTLYWRILRDLTVEGQTHIYSHDLASRSRVTAAQVRRDLMVVGYSGTPARGYDVEKLLETIEKFVFPMEEQKAIIAGVGNIGRALLKFFLGRRPTLKIVASLEINPEKFGRMIHGCPCHSVENAEKVIRDQGITVGIIAVPDKEAQYVADVFVHAGIRGILNFARTALRVPSGVYVEDIDLAMSMDRVAFFARQSIKSERLSSDKANSVVVSKESNA
ncbi:MAG: redox-sensing transcriptional repressor Rex [Acidobacteriota bacterium]|jgi:redox-sensing transcriptional repressor|nr:redox-sensing transcriptional repressor Rex [Acidobacteriota bacterium]